MLMKYTESINHGGTQFESHSSWGNRRNHRNRFRENSHQVRRKRGAVQVAVCKLTENVGLYQMTEATQTGGVRTK